MPRRKNDMDKEEMFRRIMPSFAVDVDSFSTRVAAPTAQPAQAAPQAQQPEEEQQLASKQIKAAFITPNAITLPKSDEPQMLVNVMEYLVIEKLDKAFSRFKCCKCDKCRKDVAAITLNSIAAKYVVAKEDELMKYTAQINSTEVMNAVIKAILKVRDNPRH